MLCSLLKYWNYFWNKYCSWPVSAIFPFQFTLLILLASSWYKKAKTALRMSLQSKKKVSYHFKGLYKTICYKRKFNFCQFFFSHWLIYECFFTFPIKTFVNLEKVIRFHWQVFIVYKNGENLKILVEIFHQKLKVSNVILTFYIIWIQTISLLANHGGWHRALPLPNLWICSCNLYTYIQKLKL